MLLTANTTYTQATHHRTHKLFYIKPYTHLQNKIQYMSGSVYIMYTWIQETPTNATRMMQISSICVR